jgi:hypothetical protein
MLRKSWIAAAAALGATAVGFSADAWAQTNNPAAYSCTGTQAYQNQSDLCAKNRASNANTLPKIVSNATRNMVGIITGRLESHRLAWKSGPITAMRDDERAVAERASTGSAFDKEFETAGIASLDAGRKPEDVRALDLSKDLGYGAKSALSAPNQGLPGLGNAPFVEFGTGRGASGHRDAKFGIWLGGQWSFIDDDNASTRSDGYVATGMIGADYRFSENFVAGLAFGYERTDIDTDFNRGDLEGDGFTVAPYIVLNLGRIFSVDATGGYTWLDYDVSRTTLTAGTSAFSGTKSTGSIDAYRWFGAANFNADVNLRNWLLGGSIGGLFATEHHDGFTESSGTQRAAINSDLGRFTVSAKAGYAFRYVTPYVKGAYEYDFHRDEVSTAGGDPQAANDTDRFVVGAGLDVHIGSHFSAGVEGTTLLSDEDFSNYTVRAQLRLHF